MGKAKSDRYISGGGRYKPDMLDKWRKHLECFKIDRTVLDYPQREIVDNQDAESDAPARSPGFDG